MSFHYIYIYSWFDKQNINESLIHEITSQQNTNRQKHWKDARQTTKNDSKIKFDLWWIIIRKWF